MKHIVFILFVSCAFTITAEGQTDTPIDNLVSAIRQEPKISNELAAAKESAIKEAGESHITAPSVIEALLDNVSYMVKGTNGWQFDVMNAPKYAVFPARDALVAIGQPVIPILLNKLEKTDDAKLRTQYASLLSEIAGKDRGIELLKQNISDFSDKKERLEKSLKLLQ